MVDGSLVPESVHRLDLDKKMRPENNSIYFVKINGAQKTEIYDP